MKKLLLASILAAGLAAGAGSSVALAGGPVTVTRTQTTISEGTLFGPNITVSALPGVIITGIVLQPSDPFVPPNPIVPTLTLFGFE